MSEYNGDNCLGITILDSVLVDVQAGDETETLEFQICPNVICKGDTLFGDKPPHPGVQWNSAFFPFLQHWDSAAETIAYLINEGQIVADTIEAYSEQPAVQWKVQPASIEILRKHEVVQ